MGYQNIEKEQLKIKKVKQNIVGLQNLIKKN
jgi:hypothetical protein